MAQYSKKDFASKCGLATKDLSNYIRRGKVILTGDLIDDSIMDNKDFLTRRLDKIAAENKNPKKAAGKKSSSRQGPSTESKKNKTSKVKKLIKKVGPAGTETEKYALEKKLKAAKLEETITNNKIAEQKLAKLRGEMMPAELVKSLFINHSESIKIAFSDAAENLIVVFAQRKQFSAAEVAETKASLTSIINKAIDDSIDISKKRMKNIIEEYSERKGVGEKD